MIDSQIALPWGVEAPPAALSGRRRAAELADRLRRANRQAFRLRSDLAEARALAESLRLDLAELAAERDAAEAQLNAAGPCQAVPDLEVEPWRFGRREGAR